MKYWKPQKPTNDINYFSYRNSRIAYKYYRKEKTKKTVLFLYGFGGNIEMVDMLAEEYLSKNYSVLTVDYPGHCFSDATLKFKVDDFIVLLEELLCYLNESEINLVGYSLGGMVALKLYKSGKIKIEKLVLLHSAASFSYNIFKGIFYFFLKIMLKINFKFTILDVAMVVLADKYFTKDLLRIAREVEMHNNPKSVVDYFNEIIFKNYTSFLKEIDCPVLLIGSKLDTLATVYAVRQTHKEIRNSKLIIFEDIGHLSIVTRPEMVNDVIDNFLKKD